MEREGTAAVRSIVQAGRGEIGGCEVVVTSGEIKPGDWYIAGRNTGPHLLTCKFVDERGWIVSEESAYPFDISECVKVIVPALADV